MMTIREWRGTKAGRAALQAFPGRKVRELAALVEPRPGFRDMAARRRFATNVRLWAHFWLCQERRYRRWRPKPTTPALRRDALCKLAEDAASIAKCVAALRERLHGLPDEARNLLAITIDTTGFADAASPLAKLAPDARRLVEGLDALRVFDTDLAAAAGRLKALERSAECAAGVADQAVRRGKPKRPLGDAIKGLAQIWLDATGHPPTRIWDEYREERYGPFRDFVYAAVAPLWPEGGSVDGLIDAVCTEFRSRSR